VAGDQQRGFSTKAEKAEEKAEKAAAKAAKAAEKAEKAAAKAEKALKPKKPPSNYIVFCQTEVGRCRLTPGFRS